MWSIIMSYIICYILASYSALVYLAVCENLNKYLQSQVEVLFNEIRLCCFGVMTPQVPMPNVWPHLITTDIIVKVKYNLQYFLMITT